MSSLLRAAASLPGLAAMDLGPRWTLLTWGTGDAGHRSTSPTEPWPLAELQRPGGRGGVVGWLGYEAGAACERMPAPREARLLPDVALWRVDGGLWLDRWTGRWRLRGSRSFEAEARALLQRAEQLPEPPAFSPAAASPPPRTGTADAYQDAVRAALRRIGRGELYQVNLAWQLQGPATADPVGAWLALRRDNPARHGALLHCDGAWVICNSPERYLRLGPGRSGLRVVSVPIKGTVPADAGPAGIRHLARSDKERAELTMIVDLVRNDLGRVAAAGSVRAGPRRLVRCGDLWHAEQAVRCRLRPGLRAAEAVAASFPPGSVTGAPKVAAMATIQELEAGPRGIYTGALLFLGDDERASLNVAIRTATLTAGRAHLHVGAGIVADSDPAAEWQETLAKGRVLARYVMAGGAPP